MDVKRTIRQLTTGMHVFAAIGIAVMVSASAAFAASGMCETGKVFGEARLVPDADKGAMAESKVVKDIAYADRTECRLDVRFPVGETNFPTVVWFHGCGEVGDY